MQANEGKKGPKTINCITQSFSKYLVIFKKYLFGKNKEGKMLLWNHRPGNCNMTVMIAGFIHHTTIKGR